ASILYQNIDNIRDQLATTMARAATSAALGDIRLGADSLEKKFAFLADSLTQHKPGAFYEWPVKLSAKLSYLASQVQSSDRKPTDQARDASAVLKAQLQLVQREYASLVSTALTPFNERLRARGVPAVSVIRP